MGELFKLKKKPSSGSKPSFKEEHGVTRVGKFLQDMKEAGKEYAPGLLDIAATITGREGLSDLADKIRGKEDMPEKDKEVALKLIEKDIETERERTKRTIAKYDYEKEAEKAISERWTADANSDDLWSKRTRPILVFSWTLFTMVIIIVDSATTDFNIPQWWVDIIATMAVSTTAGYFVLREIGKRNKFKYFSRNSQTSIE